MSDEGLLLGSADEATAQGASGLKVPQEMVSVSVFGVFADETCIEQKMTLKLPKGTNHDQAALFIWDQLSRLGGLTTTGTAGEYNFYPIALFQKGIRLKFGTVVGVTL